MTVVRLPVPQIPPIVLSSAQQVSVPLVPGQSLSFGAGPECQVQVGLRKGPQATLFCNHLRRSDAGSGVTASFTLAFNYYSLGLVVVVTTPGLGYQRGISLMPGDTFNFLPETDMFAFTLHAAKIACFQVDFGPPQSTTAADTDDWKCRRHEWVSASRSPPSLEERATRYAGRAEAATPAGVRMLDNQARVAAETKGSRKRRRT